MTLKRHWQQKTDQENILWVALDKQGESTNTINADVLTELDTLLDQINPKSCKGVVFYSAKSNGFIAGADLSSLQQHDETKLLEFVRQGQAVFEKLANLSVPTVAMVTGFCLGGGLELALACRYRVAQDSDDTRLGLPEVRLGILPAWGGAARLPKLLGAPAAMRMLLTGSALRAKAAAKIGLVDAAVPERQLKRAALYFIHTQPKPHRATLLQQLTNVKPIRTVLAKIFHKQTAKKVKQHHYPAPFRIIDDWEHYGVDLTKSQEQQIKSVHHLMTVNDTAKNLMRVFFLSEQLKKFGKATQFKPQWVHVIGAGTMGGDIAAWCALRGMRVTLQDQTAEQIAPAIKRAYTLFKKRLKNPRKVQAAMDRLMPDVRGVGIAKADLIIEAIFEDLAVKQELFKTIEVKAKPNAVLATNTSSIPIDEINTVLTQPERLVGIHFFNPVAKMMLVEVVRGEKTSDYIVDNAMAFVKQIDRLPLPVKSRPGFLVNRVLMPYLMEAIVMYQEGVPAQIIDKAAETFGMPMGPITLADKVGLDICLSVAKNMAKHFDTPVPELLSQTVADGKLGIKSGEGFYRYRRGKAVKVKQKQASPIAPQAVTNRLVLRLINEAAACLREDVVADPNLCDAGMIFGTGFAPFRGGPMHYARGFENDKLCQLFQQLEQQYGDRFRPDRHWAAIKASRAA